jgi:hypothetical protein
MGGPPFIPQQKTLIRAFLWSFNNFTLLLYYNWAGYVLILSN